MAFNYLLWIDRRHTICALLVAAGRCGIRQMTGQIFISYRRDESSAEAVSLRNALRDKVGSDLVFMDISSIDLGLQWPDAIKNVLKRTDTVLVVIGRDWLKSSDQYGRRRIDRDDDWVRQEIKLALATGKRVIRVLIDGAKIPPKEALPEVLADLPSRQHIEIRRDYWDHDIKLLLAQFTEETPEERSRNRDSGIYPANPPPGGPDPLSEEKLKAVLTGDLMDWKKIISPLPEDQSQIREELYKAFKFRSFQDAISFMILVAPGCDIAMHHPRCENIRKTLKVYLSTWDVGHRIADRDIQLARYFDRAYLEFPGRSEKRKKSDRG